MDSKKSNKISEIVRLQQILKKWKKLANAPKNSSSSSKSSSSNTTITSNGSKSIKFLKRTLSFSDISASVSGDTVPKGFLAVCVGTELKRYTIPTEYLGHKAFGMLLREAEEEFGFQNEGILRIPCEVSVFERILKVVEQKKELFIMNEFGFSGEKEISGFCSSEAELTPSHHPPKPMCR
ncbi:auxin-induced protein 10A5-like [Telopea speciosissima]|uniref:auxin-induced protein 10A5-like n=1 Tax=Telopea speciosissima TaxID=54955 RepID=UPI001CC53E14|nr:auxin-induced protein 10A5-like [Telopea speciosissima]